MTLVIKTQKQKQLSMKVILMMCYQSIEQLYQTYKIFEEKAQAGLLIQSLIILLFFQSIILQLVAFM